MRDYSPLKASALFSYPIVVAASLGVLYSVPLYGQTAEWPSNQDEHPGQIVYSRDVPYGTATRRFVRGEASTAQTDQSRILIDTLTMGLNPITDAESASITAPLNRGLAGAEEAISLGLAPLNGPAQGSNDFTRSESGASSTGNIISSSMGALTSALSNISRNTGSGQ